MAKKQIEVAALRHHRAKRLNIPTAELEPVMRDEEKAPKPIRYPRNPDLDPQLVWRGKDDQDWSDLIVQAPPLYIQEKIHPKVLIDDLLRQSRERREETNPPMPDLFADFNGLPDREARAEFYQHDANWSNRMILGDSLSVMASLAEREGLRGKVQCIYIDPPYGIRFNSNFQWSTTTRDVKDNDRSHITREPEQVKAFRDTWRDGIHSYLTYLRDRLTVARDLLHESGSIFVQIGDENVHRVRALMDEVFGESSFIVTVPVKKKGNQKSGLIDPVNDFVLWYSRSSRESGLVRFRPLFSRRPFDEEAIRRFSRTLLPDGREFPIDSVPDPFDERARKSYGENLEQLSVDWPGSRLFYSGEQLTSGGIRPNQSDPVKWEGEVYTLKPGLCWKTTTRTTDDSTPGMQRLTWARRLVGGRGHLNYKRFLDDFGYTQLSNWWDGLGGVPNAIYVVQTNEEIIKRCILMTTDPGDLVLDPTSGSGTTAYVSEQWGRRWITIDTSRVAFALARARVMGARYPYYLLADSPEGQEKEAEITGTPAKDRPTHGDIRLGFVYDRARHITLGSIANNAEIDVIWERWQETLEPLRGRLNAALGQSWQEWEVPHEAAPEWPAEASKLHAEWWQARIARQKEIDASIAAKAEFEYLYDKPHPDPSRIRVSGPFSVESLSPHRVLAVDADDSLIDTVNLAEKSAEWGEGTPDFAQMVLENLKTAGVQQAHKEDHIAFTSLLPWPGELICAEGHYMEGDQERRAAIFLGSEFGTAPRADLVAAAKEAAEADFNVVIACAFNFDVHSTELDRLGRIPILKARMNPDLHMADALKTTTSGNLFVVFGEPDIEIEPNGDSQIRVRIKGVDVFHRRPARSIPADLKRLRCGLWTPTTTRRASLSATPISSVHRRTPIRP
jgi:adenine-specific DNA-methyltransferase